MIWRVVLAAFLTAALSLFAFNAPRAQFNGCPAGFCSPPAKAASGCAAATAFLARTSGLSGTETTAYTTMICGMITDGVGCSAWRGSGGNLDALYIFATKDTTTAELNLCSTSFSITPRASNTFTADTGWAGDG